MPENRPQPELDTTRPTAAERDAALLRVLVGSTAPVPIPLPIVHPRPRSQR